MSLVFWLMIASMAMRRLADRAIADDQLALAAPQREQRVDDEQPGLHRLGDQIAVEDRRRRPLDRLVRVGARSARCRRAAGRADRRRGRAAPGPTGTRTTSPVPRTASPASIASASSSRTQPIAVAFERLGEAELPLVEPQELVEPRRRAGRKPGRRRPRPPRPGRSARPAAPSSAPRRASRARRSSQPFARDASDVSRHRRCSARMRSRSARQAVATTRCGPRSSRPAISAGSTANAMSADRAPSASAIAPRRASCSLGSSGVGADRSRARRRQPPSACALVVRQRADRGDEPVEKRRAHRLAVEARRPAARRSRPQGGRPLGPGAFGAPRRSLARSPLAPPPRAPPSASAASSRRAAALPLGGFVRRREDRLALLRRNRRASAAISASAASACGALRRPASASSLLRRSRRCSIMAATGRQKKRPSSQIRIDDVDGLKAERPPVDGHGVISAAGWRTAAAAR